MVGEQKHAEVAQQSKWRKGQARDASEHVEGTVKLLAVSIVGETYFAFDACFVNNPVDVVSRHTGLDRSSCNVEYLSRQSADFPHCLNTFLVEYLNVVPFHVWVVGDARHRPFWMRYRFGDFSFF